MCEPQGPWAPGLLLPMAVFAYGHATSCGLSCFCDITLLTQINEVDLMG